MVAGFIALLKVALIMAELGHTPAVALGGVTRITVGGVVGPTTPFLSGSPHPATKLSSRSAVNQILWLPCARIHASSPRLNYRRNFFPIVKVNKSGSTCMFKIELLTICDDNSADYFS